MSLGLLFAGLVLRHRTDLNSVSPSRETSPNGFMYNSLTSALSTSVPPNMLYHIAQLHFLYKVHMSLEHILLICFLVYRPSLPLTEHRSVRAEILTRVLVHSSTVG